MLNADFEKQFKKRRFKVVVPHTPYLPSDQIVKMPFQQIKDDGEFYRYIVLKSFPLDDFTYSYDEAVDVLEIFEIQKCPLHLLNLRIVKMLTFC